MEDETRHYLESLANRIEANLNDSMRERINA
jgi:hypothetical protein